MRRPYSILLFLLVLIGSAGPTIAAPDDEKYVPETDPLVLKKLEKWRDLKFGLLMHWGPYSQWGVVESWTLCSEDEPWCRRKLDDYAEYKRRYENLKTTFNPTKFDPAKWARAAKAAGMRYVVFTTKHHDGFSMFDTKLTDYKITDPGCPFHAHPRADVTRAIFRAFREQGLWTGAYFSKPDWHSEYYWWPRFATPDRHVNYDPRKYPERWKKFVAFTHGQILELLTGYGRVDILWLDGGWVCPRTDEEICKRVNSMNYKYTRLWSQDIDMPGLVKKARARQPGLIVVDRAVPGPYQNYLTPENRVPKKVLPHPWESCIIAGGGWSWVPNAKYKSTPELIHLLVDVVSKGGNLLLNIAPGPDGTWHDTAYARLKTVGNWMRVNGEAIYGTRAIAPGREGNVCFTRKPDDTLYAIVLAEENQSMPPAVVVWKAIQPPKRARMTMVGTDVELSWTYATGKVTVVIPESLRRAPPCRHAWSIRISTGGG